MTRPGLTRRQALVLETVTTLTHRGHGVAPTLFELATALGRAESTVHKHLEALRAKGYLARHWNRARSMVVVPEQDGRAAAYDAGWRDCLANELVGRLPGAQFNPGARERARTRYLESQ